MSPELLDEYKAAIHFCDVFLEKNRFELGVTAYVKLDTTFEELRAHLVAKDYKLEIAKLTPVKLTEKALAEFLNKHEFTPHGLYTLKMIASRWGIKLFAKK